jgi:hypothetical protein
MEASNSNGFESVAWVLKGVTGSESAGLLRLKGGRLTLVGENDTAFDVPVNEVTDVTFPWFYFSGGMKLTAAGEKYRLSFVKPNNQNSYVAGQAANEIVPGAGMVAVADIAGDIRKGRGAGKEWKRLLG